ncbi:hypothetical protein [Caulobacter sp.]|uniref:hypothetical protein n=1 Tax=Caulobacter sp. TaxID=78 RepID=UPI003BAB0026
MPQDSQEAAKVFSAAPQPPAADESDRIQQKALAFLKEAHQLGQGYNQALVALGFAAFLTVWAKLAPSLPRATVLLSGALLGLALVVFVAFHLLQMLARSLPGLKLGRDLQAGAGDPATQLAAFAAYEQRQLWSLGLILRAWPFVFFVSAGAGLGSALLIVGYAFWGVVYSAQP